MRLRRGMERNCLNASGLPQALQKAVFYTLKGGLSRCNSRPFALQFTAFCRAKGGHPQTCWMK